MTPWALVLMDGQRQAGQSGTSQIRCLAFPPSLLVVGSIMSQHKEMLILDLFRGLINVSF